jgi:hypothetical protein
MFFKLGSLLSSFSSVVEKGKDETATHLVRF